VNYGKGVPFLPRGTRYKSGKRLAERASERLSLSLSLFRSTGIGHGESVNQSRVSPRLVGEKRETRMSRVARRAIAQIRVVRLSPERRSRGTREFEYRRGGGAFGVCERAGETSMNGTWPSFVLVSAVSFSHAVSR